VSVEDRCCACCLTGRTRGWVLASLRSCMPRLASRQMPAQLISLLLWQSPMHNTQRRIWIAPTSSCLPRCSSERCKMSVTADPVCATRNRCPAIKKRDRPPCLTSRPINHKKCPNGDSRYLHLVQGKKKRRKWRCSYTCLLVSMIPMHKTMSRHLKTRTATTLLPCTTCRLQSEYTELCFVFY
jgi:hypothetical protein